MNFSTVQKALNQNISIAPGQDRTQQMLWNISKALLEIAETVRDIEDELDRPKGRILDSKG
jgi:hypothetical protein